MQARIFKPARTAMQAGTGKTRDWLLEYEPPERTTDPLMGWVGSRDTRAQIRLSFDSKEEAIAYAERNGILYTLIEPQERAVRPKAYADNFAFHRIGRWTH